jgi:tetratricopeptide (TPR) repeat protein
MKTIVGEKDRKIVPRWRSFRASFGSFKREQIEPPITVSNSLQSNIEDWNRERSLWTALDVVGGAIVENRLDLAVDALHQVRIDPQTPPAALAMIDEHEWNHSDEEQFDLSVERRSREEIRASRIRLAEYPYDAIEWIELARSFTTLGLLEKAERCISVALTLAPADVFVLRSSSRFFIQQDDPERAQWILTKTPRTLKDPWLLSSEIAAASVAGRESPLLKFARRLEQGDFRNEDLTELRAALATAELDSGSFHHGKKLLRRSLKGANENSLAQIQWMDHTRLGNIIDTSMAKPPNENEAAAWRSFFEGRWDDSAAKSLEWFKDQPFSLNAGIFCSYVLADLAGLPEKALGILAIALKANADNPRLKNNLAFSLIQINKLDKAAEVLSSILKDSDSAEYSTLEATAGLLAFRKGFPDQGRLLYLSAIDRFQREGVLDQAGRAATFLALEEVRSRTPESPTAVKRAHELTKNNARKDVAMKLEELREAAEVWIGDTAE